MSLENSPFKHIFALVRQYLPPASLQKPLFSPSLYYFHTLQNSRTYFGPSGVSDSSRLSGRCIGIGTSPERHFLGQFAGISVWQRRRYSSGSDAGTAPLFSSHPAPTLGTISTETKAYLTHWLEERQWSLNNQMNALPHKRHSTKRLSYMPTPQEMLELQQHTNLTKDQIRRQLWRMVNRARNRVTLQMRTTVRLQLLAQNGVLSTETRRRLASWTGLSMDQIASLMHTLQPKTEITPEKRSVVREWMIRYQFARRPRGNHMRQLIERTSLSASQVWMLSRTIQNQYFVQQVPREALHELKQWLETHNRVPDADERIALRKELQITPLQLNQLVRLYRNRARRRASGDTKRILQQWLEAHDYSNPDAVQRDELQNLTKLTRDQVKRQVGYLREREFARRGLSNAKVCQILDDYLVKHDYALPSQGEELRGLQREIAQVGDRMSQRMLLSHLRERRRILRGVALKNQTE